jgi:manganese/zinc/iron transport system permease protein
MDTFVEFFTFSDPNIRYVVLGSILLAGSASLVGCFTFLKKKALVGDAVAHSVLPGVCLAFILSGTKNPLMLVAGAFATGWISLLFIDVISAKSKIKEDTAIGLILSVFFGIGILLLTMIQHSGNANQTGLDDILFGKAASLVGNDLIIFSSLAVVLIFAILLLFKEFTIICFDEEFAKAIGFPVREIELILTTLTVLAVVTGIQAIGAILMAAILITPAAAARFWTDDLRSMIILAAVFAAFSGLIGAYVSYISPGMPTGPWIVMIISIIALFSFMFAPKKGILFRQMAKQKMKHKMSDENVLKLLFHMGEASGSDYYSLRSMEDILQNRPFDLRELNRTLKRLKKDGFIEEQDKKWRFTKAGKHKGQRVTRLHRLWELYLTEYLRIAPDHVHEDAESIEHIITPELEKRLEAVLENPKVDPHDSVIPSRE